MVRGLQPKPWHGHFILWNDDDDDDDDDDKNNNNNNPNTQLLT
jgi:hypothetical protein